MTREQWDKLRAERPDLRLYVSMTFTGEYWEEHALNITPEELVAQITAAQFQNDGIHWARDSWHLLDVQ